MVAARYSTIAGSTRLDGRSLTLYEGQPLLHRFGAFLQILDERGGDDAARLFALPDTNISRMTGAAVTTWYAAREGRAAPLVELPADIRQKVEARVATLVEQLRAHPDAELRAMASAALEHYAPEMIVLVGEEPVLVDWGLQLLGVEQATPPLAAPGLAVSSAETPRTLAPPAAAVEPDDPASHFAQPSSAAQQGERSEAPPQSGITSVPLGAADVSMEPSNRWAIGSLLALTILFAAGLVYVLWPGNLVFPSTRHGLLDEAGLTEMEEASITALEEQIGRYRAALADDLCAIVPDATLDGMAGLPFSAGQAPVLDQLQPVPALPAGTSEPAPGDPATAPEGTVAPTIPPSAPGGPPSASISSSSLLGRLDEITVLVIARGASSTSTGTGFLVAPDMVLTNYHVVEGVEQGDLMVASTKLGRYIPATLTARTQTSDIGGADFALLKLAEASPFAPATLAPALSRLDPVIAAGYPAFVVETDPSFIAGVQQGDVSQLDRVQMAVTQGVVMTAQSGINNAQVIAHSATISSGNSGGPLVDMCGRVVGVNTFARADSENALRNNYALGAIDAEAFLRANGVVPVLDGGLCSYAPTPAASATPPASPNTTERPVADPALLAPVDEAQAPAEVEADPAARPPPSLPPVAITAPDAAAAVDTSAPEVAPATSPISTPAPAEDPAESPDVLTVP